MLVLKVLIGWLAGLLVDSSIPTQSRPLVAYIVPTYLDRYLVGLGMDCTHSNPTAPLGALLKVMRDCE